MTLRVDFDWFFQNSILITVITLNHVELLVMNINRLEKLDILPTKIFIVTTNLNEPSIKQLKYFLESKIDLVIIWELNINERSLFASLEHMNSLNLALRECRNKASFLWILDPDFFIASQLSFFSSLDSLANYGLVSTPWSPRWIKKSRKVATAHFVLIDIKRFPQASFENHTKEVNTRFGKGKNLKPLDWRFFLRIHAPAFFRIFSRLLSKNPKLRFIAKYRIREGINTIKDTHLNLSLHSHNSDCWDLRVCQIEHLVHVIRQGIDVRKPKEFFFGMWWESLVPQQRSIWPREKNFKVISPFLHEELQSILNHGELLIFKEIPFGWHLRSIGRAGGDANFVDYKSQHSLAKFQLPNLDLIADKPIGNPKEHTTCSAKTLD